MYDYLYYVCYREKVLFEMSNTISPPLKLDYTLIYENT